MGSVQATLQEILKWITDNVPSLGLGGGGILLAWIAIKSGKGVMRLVLMLVAVGAVVGAVLWYSHK